MRRLLILSILFLSFFGTSTNANAFSVASGSFTLNTSTGNQAITGVGFQPKLVLFFGSLRTAGANDRDGNMLYGAATSSSARWALNTRCDWGNGSGESCHTALFTTKCITNPVSFGTTVEEDADFVSMDSDGFTINVSTAANALVIYYIAFGGTDISANVGNFQITGTGSKAVTGVGFQPTFVSAVANANGLNAYGGWMDSSFGFAKSSSNRYSIGFSGVNGATTTCRNQIATQFLKNTWNNSPVDIADFTSMDSDGFTLNVSANGNSPTVGYWAIKGCQVKLSTFNEATSTGNQSVTGVGFQPSMLVCFSVSNATSTTINTATGNIMMGAAISSSNRRSANSDSTSAAPSKDMTGVSTSKFLLHITGGVGTTNTLNADADLVSMDADGFTYNQTTADATAREVVYLAFAPLSTANKSNFFQLME